MQPSIQRYQSNFTAKGDFCLSVLSPCDFTYDAARKRFCRLVSLPWGFRAKLFVRLHKIEHWHPEKLCVVDFNRPTREWNRSRFCAKVGDDPCEVCIDYWVYPPDCGGMERDTHGFGVRFVNVWGGRGGQVTLCEIIIWERVSGRKEWHERDAPHDNLRDSYLHLCRSIRQLTAGSHPLHTLCIYNDYRCGHTIVGLPAETWVGLLLQCNWQSLIMLTSTCVAMYSLRNHYVLRGVTQQRIYFREAMIELLMRTTTECEDPEDYGWTHSWEFNIEGMKTYRESSYFRAGWSVIYMHPVVNNHVDISVLMALRTSAIGEDIFNGCVDGDGWYTRFNYMATIIREQGIDSERRISIHCAAGIAGTPAHACLEDPVSLMYAYKHLLH